jgi:hypothetical protein
MKVELQRVLELQPYYVHTASPEMKERGELIRNRIPDWLFSNTAMLSEALGIEDFFAEGRDGTGRKTRVPWVRFGSRYRSPRATEGFYIVYLFDAKGGVAYLSLNQGTTDFVAGEFVPKPSEVIASRVAWARNLLSDWLAEFEEMQPLIGLHDPRLGLGYESANIAAIPYALDSIPEDQVLLADAVRLSQGLGKIYSAHEEQPLPYEQPEVQEAEEAAERTSGARSPNSRAGFRTNSKEIKVIENHAVAVARAFYEQQGWQVRELGKPFDLEIKKEGVTLTVEVKGTSSDGHGVPLTSGEVRHHAEAFPDNALVIVRGIQLERDGSEPRASGGRLYELRGWEINPESLRVISYAYEVPEEIYDHSGISAEELLN